MLLGWAGLGPAPSHACVGVCASGWALGRGAEMGGLVSMCVGCAAAGIKLALAGVRDGPADSWSVGEREKGSSKQCAMAWAGLGWAELGFLVFGIQTWQSAWCELDGLEWKMILYHYGYSIHWMPVPKKKNAERV
jgi:hypothetical protein